MGVYLPYDDYSAMQGPAPDGFHVPLSSEWVALCGILTSTFSMANDATTMGTYLKMNMAGYRSHSSASVYDVGSYAYYWSSSPTPSDANLAHYLEFRSAAIRPQNNYRRSYGLSVRCFKNIPVAPTSSWTTLYQGTGSAGVFWNSTDGLISVSGDGTTWYTIQDKNLGATTVYNQGDNLTDANCGYFYQWGNNYGFPHSGSVTTSSTKVDASNYGPGNYYNSSTFITVSASPYNRSSVQNDNLWGGVTGVKPMSELKNAYIGEYVPPYLCFTANTAGSTIALNKTGNPTAVTLETSIDGNNWSTYTFGDTITLSNVGDKVYWRNTSTTTIGFSIDYSNYYQFAMTGSIAGSGDLNFLLNKNSTTALSNYCYYYLFYGCSSLSSTPSLTATTLSDYCYRDMFIDCTNITTLPKLPALTLCSNCYRQMFHGCSKIKLSTSQTGEYQTPYRIPTTGTGTTATAAFSDMFYGTGGTFTGTPTINTTYYTSNTVV